MIRLRRPTLDENNKLFTMAAIGGGGVIGSAISFLIGGALIANLYHIWKGRFGIARDPRYLFIAGCFAFYYFVNAASSLIHYEEVRNLWPIIRHIPFLGFALFCGRLAITPREDLLPWFEGGLIAGAIGSFVFAAVEVAVLGLERPEGLAGNTGIFAVINAVLYGGCLIVAVRRDGRLRLVATVAAACAAGALILTGMRALWPILLVAPAIVAFVYRSALGILATTRGVLAVAGLLVFLGALGYPVAHQRVAMLLSDIEAIGSDGNYSNSLGQRLLMWRAGYELVLERPILGWGPEKSGRLMVDLTESYSGMRLAFTHFHNFLLTAWVASGIFGAVAILALMIGPGVVLARSSLDSVGRAGFAFVLVLTTSYLASGLFGIMLGHDLLDSIWFFGIVAGAYLVIGPSKASTTPVAPPAVSGVAP
jgi:O-antigen ligase